MQVHVCYTRVLFKCEMCCLRVQLQTMYGESSSERLVPQLFWVASSADLFQSAVQRLVPLLRPAALFFYLVPSFHGAVPLFFVRRIVLLHLFFLECHDLRKRVRDGEGLIVRVPVTV